MPICWLWYCIQAVSTYQQFLFPVTSFYILHQKIAMKTSINALRTPSWIFLSFDHINVNDFLIPVNAEGNWKCRAWTKDLNASVTSLLFEDKSIPSNTAFADWNKLMKVIAELKNVSALCLVINSSPFLQRQEVLQILRLLPLLQHCWCFFSWINHHLLIHWVPLLLHLPNFKHQNLV